MKRALAILLGAAAVFMAATHPAAAGDKAKKDVKKEDKKEDKKQDKVPLDPFAGKFSGSFVEAVTSSDNPLGLSDAQKKKMEEIKKQRDLLLARWDKGTKPEIDKLEAYRLKLDPQRQGQVIKQIEARVKALEQQRGQIEQLAERQMYAVLTPEQRGKWNGSILHDAVAGKLRLTMLSGEQDKKLQALCELGGRRLVAPASPDAKANTQIVDLIEKEAVAKILTPAQRKEWIEWNTKNPPKGARR